VNTDRFGPVMSRRPNLTASRSNEGQVRIDRGRGTRHDATPLRPAGIRVRHHGGSTGLSLGRDSAVGETERVEIVVAQGLLDRRVSRHSARTPLANRRRPLH
jgi:hypothetical protein